jgi:hypothetical protein
MAAVLDAPLGAHTDWEDAAPPAGWRLLVVWQHLGP